MFYSQQFVCALIFWNAWLNRPLGEQTVGDLQRDIASVIRILIIND